MSNFPGQVKDKPKPRIRFCWVCSKRLYGRFYREVIYKKDGRPRIVHVECAGKVNDE